MFPWLQELFERNWTNVSIRPADYKELDRWKRTIGQHGIPVRYERDIIEGLEVYLMSVPARYIPRIKQLELIQ
ncbi:MAG: hypothetical protein HYW22_01940 [Candidatus Aenigmarchaeota archaeon]|nr:hypothetical protein [Candidatus Aenigmarchaeota archaeon]